MSEEVTHRAWNLLCERLHRDPEQSEESDTCTLRSAVKAMVAFAEQERATPQPAEARGMVEALKPFARYADAVLKRRDGAQDEAVPDDRLVFGIDGQHITIGDLRAVRAAAALSATLSPQAGGPTLADELRELQARNKVEGWFPDASPPAPADNAGLVEGEPVSVRPNMTDLVMEATFVGYVEGWCDVRFRDGSTAIVRPSGVSALRANGAERKEGK